MSGEDAMTFDEWETHCRRSFDESGPQRWGQWCFNELYAVRPDLADGVRASLIDPFHRDDKVPAFMEQVKEAW